MCGLFGFSSVPGAFFEPHLLSSSLSLLSHRGPDDSGRFLSQDRSIGLAHTRLSILDTSDAGHQPMFSADRKLALVFNGEIYNYKELRADLENDGYSFRSCSDTEVLLTLYSQLLEQSDCSVHKNSVSSLLKRLKGIFAFALFDGINDHLLLARDALGIKPLYIEHCKSGICFASEVKALPRFSRSLSPQSIDQYISFLWCPSTQTPSLAISKVGPGEALFVSSGNVQERFAWYELPSFSRSVATTQPLSLSQALSGTESHLRRAVHAQMVADVPIGAFLSGGLDSSSIVAFAREYKPDIQCFSIDVLHHGSEGFVDDLPYARLVSRHLQVPLEVVQVDASQMAAELEAMVWQLDEPLADPASLNVLHISCLARELGIKVLLSGAGGDDLFSGYRRHLALENEKWWNWLPRSFRLQIRAITGHLPTKYPFTRRLRKAFSTAHLNGDARLVHYFRWIDREDLRPLYSRTFLAALGDARAEDPMLEFLEGLPSSTPSLERMLALDQRFFMGDHNLTYTDKMSMAAGVEVRVPFLDPDLVDFASLIPPPFKQRGRHGKWILKKAMEPYLPKQVIYRPKSGFGVPLRRWLRVELRDWLLDTLSVDRLQRRGLFDPPAVHRLIAANAEGRIDASYTLLSLACIEIWCKYFLDGVPPPHFELKVR